MGIFAGVTGAKIFGQNRRITDYVGKHTVKVIDAKSGEQGVNGAQSTYFALDFEVVVSGNPNLQVGATAGWATVKGASKFGPTYFFSDVKKALAAIAHVEPESIDEDAVESVVGPDKAANGRYLIAEVYPKAKKDGSGTINVVVFKPFFHEE